MNKQTISQTVFSDCIFY